MHPDLAPLAFLLGTWQGTGHGGFSTMDEFIYDERIIVDHVGDPFLRWEQESWSPTDGLPLHFERGFLRPGGAPGAVELTLAHPLGLVEVSEGGVTGERLELGTAVGSMGRTSTGAPVTSLARRYRVEGDILRYKLDMQLESVALTRHLEATLRRVGP
jgi:nitrobindin-like protein